MAAAQVIAPTKSKIGRKNQLQNGKIRVAAYCRVSTDSEEQLNSYNSQMEHYKNLINENNDWEMVNIYADFGISGTQTKHRTEFLRMIKDAENGLIDMIVTKSISRFARNTVDTLKHVRSLKEKGVTVFFEKENLKSTDNTGELLLSLLSSIAQNESESISQNTKMGLAMKAKQGGMIGFNACLGYDYDKESKSLIINPKDAETVLYIFERYAQGIGCHRIAKELMKKGVVSPKGKVEWHDSTVGKIINNEKYIGNVLTGKTYTVDPINKKRLVNLGEQEMYYMQDHHEPIISVELWDKVQEIREKRSSRTNGGKMAEYRIPYPFSNMMKCNYCGGTIVRRKKTLKNGPAYYWKCNTSSKKGTHACPNSKGIDESRLEEIFMKVFNRVSKDNDTIIDRFMENVSQSLENKENKNDLKTINQKINKLQTQKNQLIDLLFDEKIDKIEYDKRFEKLDSEIKVLLEKQDEFRTNFTLDTDLEKRLESFRKIFKNTETMTKFDGDIFRMLVKEVVIGDMDENGNALPYVVNIAFKTGLEVKTSPDLHIFKTQYSHHAHRNRNSDDKGLKPSVHAGFRAFIPLFLRVVFSDNS